MRAVARSAASRLLWYIHGQHLAGVSGATSWSSCSSCSSCSSLSALVGGGAPAVTAGKGSWARPIVPERWIGSHISRQGDTKGSGKGKKKRKGVASGQKKKKGAVGSFPPGADRRATQVASEKVEARGDTGDTGDTGEEDSIREGGDVGLQSGASVSDGASAASHMGLDEPYRYAGPFSSAVTKVKKLSLFSCFVTISSVPIMLYLDPAVLVEGAAATSMTARMSLAGSLSAFGLGTTGLLHYFVHPYVHSLVYLGDGRMQVETLDFFARHSTVELDLKDVDGGAGDSMHPLSTFRDRRSGRVYYIDRDFFHHDKLLAVLAPEGDEEVAGGTDGGATGD